MEIAAVTEGGTTISRHFGKTPVYLLVTIEHGAFVASERREKLAPTSRRANRVTTLTVPAATASPVASCDLPSAPTWPANAFLSTVFIVLPPLLADRRHSRFEKRIRCAGNHREPQDFGFEKRQPGNRQIEPLCDLAEVA